MSDLFKEMCSLAGQLSEFAYFIKADESNRNLFALHLKVSDLCIDISGAEFDDIDDLYWETINKILGTERVIHSFKENHIKLPGVIDHINTIIDNVKKIMEIYNEK